MLHGREPIFHIQMIEEHIQVEKVHSMFEHIMNLFLRVMKIENKTEFRVSIENI